MMFLKKRNRNRKTKKTMVKGYKNIFWDPLFKLAEYFDIKKSQKKKKRLCPMFSPARPITKGERNALHQIIPCEKDSKNTKQSRKEQIRYIDTQHAYTDSSFSFFSQLVVVVWRQNTFAFIYKYKYIAQQHRERQPCQPFPNRHPIRRSSNDILRSFFLRYIYSLSLTWSFSYECTQERRIGK